MMRSLCWFLLILSSFFPRVYSSIRAAIDIGSKGPKLRIAQIDRLSCKIVKLLHSSQYPVIFQKELSAGSSKTLTPQMMKRGVEAVSEAIAVASSMDR